jgi:hypothetical protein
VSDPFEQVNSRYRIYCLVHGAQSPAEIKQMEAAGLGRNGHGPRGYLLWLTEHFHRWRYARGLKRDHVMSDADHADFDQWLADLYKEGIS